MDLDIAPGMSLYIQGPGKLLLVHHVRWTRVLLGVLTDISRVTAVFVGYCFFPSKYAYWHLLVVSIRG